MNVVKHLLQINFSSLPLQEKLLIKTLGPHQPNLKSLNQTEKLSNGKQRQRNFNHAWYQTTKWLSGCEETCRLFCFPCMLFKGDSSWTKTGVKDLKHLKEKIKSHENSRLHMNNSTDLAMIGCVSIAQQLDSGYRNSIKIFNEQVNKTRYILFKMIDCIKFCGTFELALRGHDETDESSNPGVFLGLVNFIADIDSALRTHLEEATVFKGTSKTIQNELLGCMLAIYYEEVRKEIPHAKFVAIQADETTDFSLSLQLALVFRYEVNGNIVERFWKFLNPSRPNAKSISEIILSELNDVLGEDKHKLIAQTYDGAAVMSGHKGGVQTIIKETYPNALYIHCYAHQLNLIMQQSTLKIKEVNRFFMNLNDFPAFFTRSTQRTKILDSVVARRIPRGSATRWNFSSRLVCTVFEQKDELIQCLDIISEHGEFDTGTITLADGLRSYLRNGVFVSWLTLFSKRMPHVDILYNQVQKRNTDPLQISNNLKQFCEASQNIRNCIKSDIEEDSEIRKRPRVDRAAIAKEVCDR